MTERVTGIGGIFFKAKDKAKLLAWYREHLGVDVQDWGGASFEWRHASDGARKGQTVWTVFKSDSKYFAPPFMINYIVDDLDKMRAQLKAAGVTVDDKVDASEFGRFGWAMDPEGNRIELWEPPRTGSQSTT